MKAFFRRALTVVSYACVAGGPVLAATGVGLPVAGILGAVGVASGAWLHFLDSPMTPPDVMAAAKASVAVAKAVEAAKSATPGRP
jgi:hypothetical protein